MHKLQFHFRSLRSAAALFTAFLLLTGLLATANAFAGTTGSLSGIAVNSATHAPIVGAKITVAGPSALQSTTTDKAGRFTFSSLPPDAYSVTLSADGYTSTILKDVDVTADNLLDVTLTAASSTSS
jgi:hypothetical protein